MKLEKDPRKYLLISFCIMAVCIVAYVLFLYPMPGVADQGDFDRVMVVSNLELTNQAKSDPNFNRFFNYTVTEYKISDYCLLGFFVTLFSTSIGYLITFISLICKVLGQDVFKTNYLAVAYSALYIFSIAAIIKYICPKNITAMISLILLSLFILFDGNYLLWFNSLYGEPMMVTTLLLYISSWLYYYHHKNVLKSQDNFNRSITFTFLAAYFFLGSKMQVITALPAILLMQGKLIWENRKYISIRMMVGLSMMFFALILYPLAMNSVNGAISKDTQYNSVFYGVLKDSKTPEQDLIDMGLNSDMAVEAGKHSYLEDNEYVKYVPGTPITEKEFYSKMSNGKLVKFYITHPLRLIQGMKYTAEHAFFTGTSLGKYDRSYSEEPISEFNRFTYWSSLRQILLPKKLLFILSFFVAVLAVSILTFVNNKSVPPIKDKVYLFWMVAFIGLIQFPMPFVGNGQADTTKQLYLFNFVFDIILLVSICWCFDRILKRFFK